MRRRGSVTGYKNPAFDIKTLNNQRVMYYELALCDEDGLTEEYEFLSVKHRLLNYQEVVKPKGIHYKFTLSYKSWSDHETLAKFCNMMDEYTWNPYTYMNYRTFLIPRVDVPSRKFEVVYTGEPITLNLMKGYDKGLGNRGVEFVFQTKYNIGWLDWRNLDNQNIMVLENTPVT